MKAKNIKFNSERGVPLPPVQGNGKGFAAAIRSLKKNESVFLPMRNTAQAGSVAIEILGKGNYATRAVVGGGVRVWRIK